MGWSYPDISLEDLLSLVKGFVDIIILASGYQSSGLPAVWDAENIKKAIRWGLFFEDVFGRLCSLDDYQDSVKEFNSALLELKANPYFPQGLAHLSSATLTKARDFVLRHLLQPLRFRDAHLSALLTAAIETDLDELSKMGHDCLNVYIDKLMQQIKSLNLIPGKMNLVKDSMTSDPTVDFMSKDQAVHDTVINPNGQNDAVMDLRVPLVVSNIKTNEDMRDHSSFMIEELLQRQTAMSHVSSAEKCLDVLAEILTKKTWVRYDDNSSEEPLCSAVVKKEKLMGFDLWNQWRTRNLSYLLDNKTIRLVSGAKLIFSAPKVQWLQVFESLKVSNEAQNDDLLEIIELSLLGLISRRWSGVVEYFMSVSYDIVPISKQYYDVHHLLEDRSELLHSNELTLNSKEHDILEYVTTMLIAQPHQLWKLTPILAAAAIPSRSTLFRLYLSELGKQVKGDSSTVRCCTCTQDGKEHNNCEIAERIWCLYAFHIKGSLKNGL
ncbi:uncharacterized protein LOC131245791 isoform X2 [Magnolia sinica]|uniref:uncharacterized protein LOC131245791 isoform X2 n=1 Tax=Magnolia sinica TaxID=86752 RepID=UPI00265A4BA0|nr:uncharacterized protein LOC131245791 isoform X2 [Magnolia sinica]